MAAYQSTLMTTLPFEVSVTFSVSEGSDQGHITRSCRQGDETKVSAGRKRNFALHLEQNYFPQNLTKAMPFFFFFFFRGREASQSPQEPKAPIPPPNQTITFCPGSKMEAPERTPDVAPIYRGELVRRTRLKQANLGLRAMAAASAAAASRRGAAKQVDLCGHVQQLNNTRGKNKTPKQKKTENEKTRQETTTKATHTHTHTHTLTHL